MTATFPPLTIGKHTAKHPIIQGGMGVRISTGKLAAAVANAGGVGVIASVALGQNYTSPSGSRKYFTKNIEALRDEMRYARSRTDGVIGVNCMVAITDYIKMIEVSCEEGANMIISGAGLPLKLPEYVQDPNVALVPIISEARAAKVIIKKWERAYKRQPDAFLIESPNKAAGHLGAHNVEDVMNPKYSLDVVVPALRKMLKEDFKTDIPIIAAGGVFDYNDIKHIIDIGGNGVQMGTRFVCTHECDVPDNFKQAFINATADDVVLIASPVGMPGRGIKNKFLERVLSKEKIPVKCIANCLWTCDPKVTPYCIVDALDKAQRGDLDNGLIFAGTNVSKVDKIVSVEELMHELTTPPE